MTTTILVTGASGFIASHIVKHLLEDKENDYVVRGTVRSLESSSAEMVKNAFPEAVANGKLILYAANLTEAGSFDEAVKDCDYVLHTASPFNAGRLKDPQKELIEPAVNGTREVINSVEKHGQSVKKIVLTSSIAAVVDVPKPNYVYTEKDWNDTSSVTSNPYQYSKMLAEKEAWKMSEEKTGTWELACINPAMVVGPLIYQRIPAGGSMEFICNILNGGMRPVALNICLGFVAVEDVAKAHILAMTNENAKDRYLCTTESLWVKELGQRLTNSNPELLAKKKISPVLFLPKFLAGPILKIKGYNAALAKIVNKKLEVKNEKIQSELGLEFTPLDECFKSLTADLHERKLIK